MPGLSCFVVSIFAALCTSRVPLIINDPAMVDVLTHATIAFNALGRPCQRIWAVV